VQPSKAWLPMLVTFLGIVIEVRPLQLLKAAAPMPVTLSGIKMEVRLVQLEKAEEPMLVTLFGIVVFGQPAIRVFVPVSIIALQLSRESYTLFSDSTTMEFKLLQPPKALKPMLVTLSGMVKEVRLMQPENADVPMLVTLLGMVMEVRLVIPEKA